MNEHKSSGGTLEGGASILRRFRYHRPNISTDPVPMLQDVLRHFGNSQANLFGLVAIRGL